MATILMSTQGTHGDVLPFIRLGGALRQAGHEVTLFTHAPFGDRVARAGLEFVPVDTVSGYERHMADTTALIGSRDLSWNALFRRHGLFEQLAWEVRQMADRHRPGDTVLIGRHTSTFSVRFAAELLGAPSAWVALSPSQMMLVGMAVHSCRTQLAPGMDAVRRELGLAAVTDWRSWFKEVGLELGLWPEWFDEAGPRTPRRVVRTGFVVPDEDPGEGLPAGAEALLAERPVLLTGGTSRMQDCRFYEAAVEGCAGRPVMLVARHADLVPDPLPDGMTWFRRLPFRDVVPRVAALVHHGGIGTLTRALAAGVPQVMLADTVDRPDNAARLSRLGLATWLPSSSWNRDEISAAVAEAADDTGYGERCRKTVGALDPEAGLAEACARIELLLEPATGLPA
ncbi:glycosyltransferase [Acrocarpospora sp. B8E8]|uniref:glycosyltransferase n=1 Tax=Acrocarpospora sp. B8E8 TaxID=3153572 RepID=UPI00325D74D0